MKKLDKKQTGELFNEWRRRNFKLQKDCAEYFGVPASHVSKVENGAIWPSKKMQQEIGIEVITETEQFAVKKGK